MAKDRSAEKEKKEKKHKEKHTEYDGVTKVTKENHKHLHSHKHMHLHFHKTSKSVPKDVESHKTSKLVQKAIESLKIPESAPIPVESANIVQSKDKEGKEDKKKAKKEKKEGIELKEEKDKKDKKEKKEKKSRKSTDSAIVGVTETAVAVIEDEGMKKDESDTEGEDKKVIAPVERLLLPSLPFAKPMANEKVLKKVFKGIKKAAKQKVLKRGVKEVIKSVRKTTPNAAFPNAPAIVVIAGDIWPADVISHIPVACEVENIPYVFVPSRIDLGLAGLTQRPTSVIMLIPYKSQTPEGNPIALTAEQLEWNETYKDVAKAVASAQATLYI